MNLTWIVSAGRPGAEPMNPDCVGFSSDQRASPNEADEPEAVNHAGPALAETTEPGAAEEAYGCAPASLGYRTR
jgi:hypothetical protein